MSDFWEAEDRAVVAAATDEVERAIRKRETYWVLFWFAVKGVAVACLIFAIGDAKVW